MDAVWLRLNQIIAEMDSLEMALQGPGAMIIANSEFIFQARASGLITDN